jgi:hypothetical protein
LAERAQNYVAQSKKGIARKDLVRILAADSDYYLSSWKYWG